MDPEKRVQSKPVPNIVQHGIDGFGHQLEGTMGAVAMHVAGKATYMFNHRRSYTFAHPNVDATCESYMRHAMTRLHEKYPNDRVLTNRKHVHEVWKIPETPDLAKIYSVDNAFYEPVENMVGARALLTDVFGSGNPHLPAPSYENANTGRNVVVHVRLGDAVRRQRELPILFACVKKLRDAHPDHQFTVHTNGDVEEQLSHDRTTIHDKGVHVLQVLSDFVHADILVISDSSLSIAASWVVSDTCQIVAPSYKAANLQARIRPGFIHYSRT